MTQQFASPIGIGRDPHWDDAWTDKYTNEYVLPHPDDPSGFTELRAGRASELGKAISNTYTLNQWHQRMVLMGVAETPRIMLDTVNILHDGRTPKEKRKALNTLATEAKTRAGAKEPAALGTGYHKMSELIDAGSITLDKVPEPWKRDMVAYVAMLHKMGIVHVPEMTEKIIWVRSINIAGRFDRLVRYLRHCDKWHVEDLKSGRDMQYGWGENPVQFQVYAMATDIFDPGIPPDRGPGYHMPWTNADVAKMGTWSKAPEICQELALLHHLPVGGPEDEDGNKLGYSESVLYEVDLTTEIPFRMRGAWGEYTSLTPVELCIAVQQWRKAKRIGKPVARIRVTDDGEVIDTPLTLMERIDLAGTDAELDALWAESRGEWKGWHTTRARERREILAS